MSHRLNIGPHPFASGGYGDVYEGTLDVSRVSIKRVRVYTQDDPKQATKVCYYSVALPILRHWRNPQTFCQEAVIWKRLTHPNIVPLLGITITPFQLISNWMPGGDLPVYIKKHPDQDRLELVCASPVVFTPHLPTLSAIRRR